ncbi:epidermal growth factor-like protein 7 isoform X3 [Grammomys surdaster]|uniref:epidermal growth factor-like protein 7 isoform X3 n=1 Tax=Grammomys surdaster TaxID=491861 RepID=UPI00109F9F4B|nr:epidermal growth factor-like protein 7 isoform X3 [Grammomys surdaster]
MQTMWGSRELLVTWFLVLAAGTTEHVYRPSRRVCTVGVSRATVSETFVQRVYQPYLTTCDGHRTCSTYRTIYRTAYRRSPGLTLTRPRYACCPGWKRTSGLPGACGAAVCQPPCGNGGSCIRPGQCRCPVGWQGDTCQTDVDECSTGEASCPQRCVNTVGSYWCQCWEGQSPSADGMFCLSKEGPSPVAPNPTAGSAPTAVAVNTGLPQAYVGQEPPLPDEHLDLPPGVDSMVREEVYRLQARVDVLEQKLQLVLAPLYSLASRSTEHGLQDPGSLLAHSFQQLDRIDSLSEQVSFLEEQLGSCSCKKDL